MGMGISSFASRSRKCKPFPFPANAFTNNKEILLILYYWKKARTTRNCSYVEFFSDFISRIQDRV